jgi:predicted Fe-Mo cluster-binding NifX family protein
VHISWLKSKNDTSSYNFVKNMGLDVYEIEDLEKTDDVIQDAIR